MGWLKSLHDMLNRDATAGMAQFDCPVCRGTRLRETRLGDYGKVILDVCPRCHGVWLETGELDRLDGSPWTNVEEHEFHQTDGDHKVADCPKCAVALTPLSPRDCPEVIVDRCPKCDGFWLDSGELDRMKAAAAKLDADAASTAGDTKPAGWSDLRWRIHQLQAGRE